MLQAIRHRARGWVAWVIVILISIPFALFGIQEYFGVSSDPVVAVVEGTDIKQSELERRLRDFRETMRRLLGENYRADLFDDNRLSQRVLETMVDEKALQQATADWNMQPTDAQVRELIQSIPAFQLEGAFNAGLYRTSLRNQGVTSAFFEQQVRQDIVLRQFEDGWQNSHFVTEQQLNDFVRLEAQKRAIRYVQIPMKPSEPALITEKQIQSYYQQNPDKYKIPAQVKLAYLHLSENTLGQQIELDEPALQAYFAERKDEFTAPEERKLRHILIAQKAGDEAAQLQQAETLLAQLRAGADFAELAENHSEDPGSAKTGGDLGWMERDAFVKPFADAAFDLTVGGLSEPVKTEFGYHLIQLEAIRGGDQPDFATQRTDIAEAYRAQQVEALYYDEFERLATVVYESPDSLEPASELLNLPIQETGWLARSTVFPEPLNTEKIKNTAFSTELLQGNNSELIELSPINAVVLRAAEHKVAARKPLAEVSDQIVASIATTQALEKTRHQGEQIIQDLYDGASFNAKVLTWAPVKEKSLDRYTEELPQSVIKAVFAASRSDAEQVNYLGVMAEDSYYVIAIDQTEDATPDALDAQRLKQYQMQQEEQQRNAEYRELRKQIRAGMSTVFNLPKSDSL
ncbi:MAG: SurA N-terminal domain-containing protein [Pseudomonadota bacterium]